MDSDSRSYLIISLLLVALAAFFAVTETAISSVSKNRLKMMADRGDARAKKALYVLDHFERAITTLLICTNIVHISVASIVTVAVTRIWGLSAVSISTIVTTIVVFFAGEMLPKSIGKKKPEHFTLSNSGILMVLMKICAPLSAILSKIGVFVSKKLKTEPEVSVTEEELYNIIEDMSEEGSIDEEQADLLSSALRFARKTAGQIMTPVENIAAVNIEDPPEKILKFLREQNHSRVPVYKGNIDHIIGILQVRKVLKSWIVNNKIPRILPLLDHVYYTTPETEVDDLLDYLSEKKATMAVVREKKGEGKTLGLVSVEDILEELVGEIYDEDDKKPEDQQDPVGRESLAKAMNLVRQKAGAKEKSGREPQKEVNEPAKVLIDSTGKGGNA